MILNNPDDLRPDVNLPKHGETAAFTIENPKTAALCYDRVWDLFGRIVPDDIRFYGDSGAEEYLYGRQSAGWGAPFNERIDFISEWNSSKFSYEFFRKGSPVYSNMSNVLKSDLEDWRYIGRADNHITYPKNSKFSNLRMFRDYFWNSYEVDIIPVYPSSAAFNSDYPNSTVGNNGLVVALTNLNIVEEDSLSWEQVREFRKDKENRKLYRNLLHWMDKDLLGKSQSFIEDELSIKLEKYESALKKHEIKTVLGVISETLDGKYLLGTAGVALTSSILGNPTLGLLVAGGLTIGKVAVKAAEMFIDLDDAEKGPDSEIAWIYEIKHELKRKHP